MRRIALISEHASPLAALGGADGGGQNVYVAWLARHLAAQGHDVDVFTRRDDPGPQDAADLETLYAADPAKLRLIPCGFDPAEFWPTDKRAARQLLGLDPDERVVLQLGRMVPRKGVDTVIRGVARLRRDRGVAARL